MEIQMSDILNDEEESIVEKNLVWVFGFPENMVNHLSRQLALNKNNFWSEPLLCKNLGKLRIGLDETNTEYGFFEINPDYSLSKRFCETWKFYLRKLILNRIYAQFPDLTKKIIISEPEGETASFIISETLPKSKMIFLLPDDMNAINSFSKKILENDKLIQISKLSKIDSNIAQKISTNRWKKIKNIINQVSESHKDIYHLVKLENFKTNSLNELDKIFRFLKISNNFEDLQKKDVQITSDTVKKFLGNLSSFDESKLIQEISPNDTMFKTDYSRYFQAGKEALQLIQFGMKLGKKNTDGIEKILDFPSGHGRVLRYLKSYFPKAKLTACDIDKEMVDFCQKIFDAQPIYSKENFNQIDIKDRFDLIWCGSLFTHINEKDWNSLLNLFSSILADQGILVLTFSGSYLARFMEKKPKAYGLNDSKISDILEQYKKNGFGFARWNQGKNYGISLASTSFVLSKLEKIPELRILTNIEKGWLNQLDVIILQKK